MAEGTTPKDWIDYLQALLTPTIALLGIMIAWLQWRINNDRLKLERFEHRFTRFEATRKFLQCIIQQGDVVEEERRAFLSATVGSRFVFDDKIADFLDKLHDKAVDLQSGNRESRHGSVGTAADKAKELGDLKRWFNAEIQGLEKRFAKYF